MLFNVPAGGDAARPAEVGSDSEEGGKPGLLVAFDTP